MPFADKIGRLWFIANRSRAYNLLFDASVLECTKIFFFLSHLDNVYQQYQEQQTPDAGLRHGHHQRTQMHAHKHTQREICRLRLLYIPPGHHLLLFIGSMASAADWTDGSGQEVEPMVLKVLVNQWQNNLSKNEPQCLYYTLSVFQEVGLETRQDFYYNIQLKPKNKYTLSIW